MITARRWWVLILLVSLMSVGCDKPKDGQGNTPNEAPRRDRVPSKRDSGGGIEHTPKQSNIGLRDIDVRTLVVDGTFSESAKNRVFDILSANIGSGKFRESWDLVRSIPASDSQKTNFYFFVLHRLAEIGETDLAYALLSETFGSGKVRTDLLGAVYGSAKFSLEDLRMERKKLEYPDERAAIDRVIGNRLINADKLDSSEFGSRHPLGADDIAAIARGLGERLKRMRNVGNLSPEAAVQEGLVFARGLVADETTSKGLISAYLETAGKYAPFEVWNEFESVEAEFDSKSADGIRNSIAGAMAAKNPSRSMELLTAKPQWSGCLAAGIEAWLQVDSRAASDWMSASKSRLSIDQMDMIALGNVRFALANAEIESAGIWLKQISGVQTRQQAEAAIKIAAPKN